MFEKFHQESEIFDSTASANNRRILRFGKEQRLHPPNFELDPMEEVPF